MNLSTLGVDMLRAILANLWRLACAIADWRAMWRWLNGQPAIDVAIITNVRDEDERYRFWGSCVPTGGHSSGARIYINGVAGRVRGIYVTAEEMLTKQGRQKAKMQFVNAVQWAEKRGAKVVLLAASTKRLFGRDGAVLKGMFPNITFTIGDNGTAQLLCDDIDHALAEADLAKKKSRILILGPYGILGTAVTEHLSDKGYKLLGFGSNQYALDELAKLHPIEPHYEFDKLTDVDAVVCCTHSPDAKLTPEAIARLTKPYKKLLVIDVAEPANLDKNTYNEVQPHVVRQDAGNAQSEALTYVLGSFSSRMLHLKSNVVFGCFAEALSLHHGIYRNHNHRLLTQDWFQVNNINRSLINEEFTSLGVTTPTPLCFGEKVPSFNLEQTAEIDSVRNVQLI